MKRMISKKEAFTYKDIPTNIRQYIINSCKIDNELKYQNEINNKRILILDDTIATGKSISDVSKLIYETYDCKSVDILTLFSGLKSK